MPATALPAKATRPDHRTEWVPPDPGSPAGLVFIADVHALGTGTDMSRFEKDLEVILGLPNTGIVLVGDIIDNHVKHLAALLDQRNTPEDQWDWFYAFLLRVAPKLVAVISGNHEAWNKLLTGFDPLRFMTRALRVPYDADEMELRVCLADVTYSVGLRHKYGTYSNKLNPALKVMRWWEQGDFDFDIGVIGHDHTPVVYPFVRHGRQRWAIRPGSYQTESPYAVREGYHGTLPVTPVAVFRPDRYDVLAVPHVDWAVPLLGGSHEKAPGPGGAVGELDLLCAAGGRPNGARRRPRRAGSGRRATRGGRPAGRRRRVRTPVGRRSGKPG